MSLPSCPNYPTTQASVQVKNCSDRALNLLSQRDELRHSLLLDRSGETTVRSRVQADGNLLNVETILYSALTGVDGICQQIKNNCDQQAMIVKSLKSEYTKWNKLSTALERQWDTETFQALDALEDALRDVNENLNMFDENMQLVEGLTEVRDAVEKCLKEVMDKLGIQ